MHSQTLHGSVQVPMYIVPDGQSNHQTVMFHQTMSDDEATHQVSNGIPKAIKTAHRGKKVTRFIPVEVAHVDQLPVFSFGNKSTTAFGKR